ncbi:MAG: hypothetical protein AAGA66_05210 [Bacteroidota bacterium]
MKEQIATEVMFFFIAIIVAIPVAFLYLYLIDFEPAFEGLSKDEKVLEMDLFLIGGLLGFIGLYLVRFTIWGVKKVLTGD